MKELLYYPGFEVKDETWLKFALLYLDHISPIIPYIHAPEESYLTPTFMNVKEHSDLIRIKRPLPDDMDVAYGLALKNLEVELEKKYYRRYAGTSDNDHLQLWRNQDKHDVLLYEGKYDAGFAEYCIENHFGEKAPRGLKLSRDVLNLYMSYLAEAISEREHIDLISDSVQYEESLIRSIARPSKNSNGSIKNLQVARQEIQFAVPLYLKQIPLDYILKIRQSDSFAWERKAYIAAVDNVIEKRNNGTPDYSMEKELQQNLAFVHLMQKLPSLALKLASIPLKIKTLQGVEVLGNIASTSTEISNDIRDFRNEIGPIHQKYYANRYLVSLKKLSKYYRAAP